MVLGIAPIGRKTALQYRIGLRSFPKITPENGILVTDISVSLLITMRWIHLVFSLPNLSN